MENGLFIKNKKKQVEVINNRDLKKSYLILFVPFLIFLFINVFKVQSQETTNENRKLRIASCQFPVSADI